MSFIELTHIYKQFSGTVAVDDFNLKAEQGEFISFLGPVAVVKPPLCASLPVSSCPTPAR